MVVTQVAEKLFPLLVVLRGKVWMQLNGPFAPALHQRRRRDVGIVGRLDGNQAHEWVVALAAPTQLFHGEVAKAVGLVRLDLAGCRVVIFEVPGVERIIAQLKAEPFLPTSLVFARDAKLSAALRVRKRRPAFSAIDRKSTRL